MSGVHLNEETLQQYTLDPAACPPEAVAHLSECVECRIQAGVYAGLGKALRDQPAPEFSFDLATAVMARLNPPGTAAVMGGLEIAPPEAAPVGKRGKLSRLVVPLVIVFVAAIPAWLFRKTAVLVFSEMAGPAAWIIPVCAGVAVLFRCYKYYRRYQEILQLINK
ncbi:MAG TPA: hypothetical protein VHE54_11660 [Puia sp.]|nr:hypothetical protein [Puia sp.]